jgi:serine/threonine protein kinase
MSSQTAHLPRRIGPYEIRSLLGEGGMGVVYLGISQAGELVAVKQIRGVVLTERDKARFSSEIEALKIVYGARVVPFIDGDSDPADQAPWLAVKFIPGNTLSDHIDSNGPLAPVLVAILGAALAEGLQSIHQAKLLHRDLKARNIICGRDGPFVIDFGLALLTETKVRRAEEPGRLTATGDVVGTLVCMPPEQVRGEPLTPAADIYALGATLVYAATGHYPYAADSQFALMVQINSPSVSPNLTGLPPELEPIVNQMLSMNAIDRPGLNAVITTLVGIVNALGFTATDARELLRRETAATTPREAELSTSINKIRSEMPGRRRSSTPQQTSSVSIPVGALQVARNLRLAYSRSASL